MREQLLEHGAEPRRVANRNLPRFNVLDDEAGGDRVERNRRRRRDRFERLTEIDDSLIEAIEIDLLVGERLDQQLLGLREEPRSARSTP